MNLECDDIAAVTFMVCYSAAMSLMAGYAATKALVSDSWHLMLVPWDSRVMLCCCREPQGLLAWRPWHAVMLPCPLCDVIRLP